MKLRIAVALGVAIIAAPASATESTVENIGDWQLLSSPDPMTDVARYGLRSGGKGGEISYYCPADRSGVSVYVGGNTLLYSGSRNREVEYRVDNLPSVKVTSWLYLDRSVSVSPVKQFSKDIADGKSLKVRLITYDLGWTLIELPIDGAREAINRIYELCGKKSPLAG